NGDDGWAPAPEQLAAYADGELEGPLHTPLKQRVAEWLADHPDARAELESYRRLAEVWQATTPAEPDDGAWRAVWQRLERIPPPQPVEKVGPRKWRVLPWVAAAVAAAGIVWLALWLPGQLRQGNAPVQEDNQAREKPQPLPGPQGVPVEAWPV